MKDRARSDMRGFSLVELLIVVAIIAIMAAISLPAISRYVRNYRITGAMQQVSGEMTRARSRAINRNVNFGVIFQIRDADTYEWVMEDAPNAFTRQDIEDLGPPPVAPIRSTRIDLPQGIVFEAGAPGVNDCRFRFNRLGQWCDPELGVAQCPPPNPAPGNCPGGNFLVNAAGGANPGTTVTLWDQRNSLRRQVRVAPGGRVSSDNR
jgi:prepilin-type N-terminal cleavage/methylation domain-containing protein